MSDAELLATRICDLDLRLESSWLAPLVEQLYDELEEAGFAHFRPRAYLGDEWFSPDGVPAIAIPFWLAHQRLARLERRLIGYVEGGTPEWCLRLLRHEAGHCLDHSFALSSTREWRALFGDPRVPYDADDYDFDPKSKDFVIHLEDHYAQCHPEEDFAETFAVVLDPASDWRRRYARWPKALAKLRYVDGLIRELGPQKPLVGSGPLMCQARRMRRTLGKYYSARCRQLGKTPPIYPARREAATMRE